MVCNGLCDWLCIFCDDGEGLVFVDWELDDGCRLFINGLDEGWCE